MIYKVQFFSCFHNKLMKSSGKRRKIVNVLVVRSHNRICETWGCHTSFAKDSGLLVCPTVSLGECSAEHSSAGFKRSGCWTHEEAHTTVLWNVGEPLTCWNLFTSEKTWILSNTSVTSMGCHYDYIFHLSLNSFRLPGDLTMHYCTHFEGSLLLASVSDPTLTF